MTADPFLTLFDGLGQQGPGSEASTKKALSLLPALPENPRILDLGCGPGRQTVTVAKETGARVVAVDVHQPFLDQLAASAEAAGVKVETRCQSMDQLSDPPGSYDLIWSEGAIYLMGLENALKRWRPLLAEGGLMGFTEASWLVDVPPAEALEFWVDAYPGMGSVRVNCAKIAKLGFETLETFPLLIEDWWRGYYTPLRERIEKLGAPAESWPELGEVLEATESEIELFERYHESYGYVFYLLRRC